MKTPRFLLGAIVLFWGWQVHTLWIAICLAVIIESSRMVKTKFEFKPADFNKFVDISIVFLAGVIVVSLTLEAQKAIMILLKWLPVIFFPLICAQEFSVKGTIDSRSFFILKQKQLKANFYDGKEIDISFTYSLFCILSSATANSKGPLFYAILVLFFFWGLWQARSKRVSIVMWFCCVLMTIFLGYAGHTFLRATSMRISQWMMEYYAGYYADNPFNNFTAMGEIGKLKMSDTIVLRASFQDYRPAETYLLHKASYTGFAISNWYAGYGFESIENGQDKTVWQINPVVTPRQKVTLYFKPSRKNAVLSLPSGVLTIAEMKAGSCSKNTLQSVRVEDIPPLLKGIVSYTGDLRYDAPPSAQDLQIPKQELSGIETIGQDLALDTMSEQQILTTIRQYFLSRFTYSLELEGKQEQSTPLQNFLYHTKSGHCEFFATAATLLLRQAKIPARYATGYLAHEYSDLENQMVIRQKDAHAWSKAFVQGQWINFDITPPSFWQKDNQHVKTSVIRDFFSFLGFKLSQLRHETGARLMNQYGLWLILPLGLILFFRLKQAGRVKRIKVSTKGVADKPQSGREISFYLIEEVLSQQGFPRHPHETYVSWLERIEHHFDNKNRYDHLKTLLKRHNQYRFSRSRPTKAEKNAFDRDINNIVETLSGVVL